MTKLWFIELNKIYTIMNYQFHFDWEYYVLEKQLDNTDLYEVIDWFNLLQDMLDCIK